MAEPAYHSETCDDIPLPDVSNLVTEDDTPVDNFFQDKQANFLTHVLDVSWPEGRPFISAADVGLFATGEEDPVVPDMFLSVGVSFPEDPLNKEHRSYYMWRYGKPPEVVVEFVSNLKGGEESTKLTRYARIKVPYYVVYDPHQFLSNRFLRVRQLTGASYVDKIDSWFPELSLGLCIWQGEYDGMVANWLRWCRHDGTILLTGREKAEAERERANAERERANAEGQRADAEQRKREALESKLRELGIDPASIS